MTNTPSFQYRIPKSSIIQAINNALGLNYSLNPLSIKSFTFDTTTGVTFTMADDENSIRIRNDNPRATKAEIATFVNGIAGTTLTGADILNVVGDSSNDYVRVVV